MCKSCGCSTSGMNPLQQWRTMSDECKHMRHEGYEAGLPVRFCIFHGISDKRDQSFCLIDNCPRMKVELPEERYNFHATFGNEEGVYTTLCGAFKSDVQQRAKDIIETDAGKRMRVHYESWIPYNGYVIYMMRLKDTKWD